jgi:hypothetical protein
VAERETLIKIEAEGGVLILLDGRRLMVRPEDLPKSSGWLPMSELEISEESGDPVYTLKVRNIEQSGAILATWQYL